MMPILILLLVDYKANPNNYYKVNNSFFSPLHTAARRALPEVVELLIRHNANIDFLSNKGKTALSYIEEGNCNDRKLAIIEMLDNPTQEFKF